MKTISKALLVTSAGALLLAVWATAYWWQYLLTGLLLGLIAAGIEGSRKEEDQ